MTPSADLSSYQVVRKDNLVMNRLGKPHGAVGVSQHEGIISPAYFVCGLKTGIHPRFLHYLIRTRLYISEVERRAKWMPPSQFDISWEQFREIEAILPPFETQRAIADLLDRETARVDALIERKKNLGALLQTRFKSLRRRQLLSADTNSQFLTTRLKYLIELPVGGIWGESPGENDVDVTCYRAGDLDRFDAITNPEKAPKRSISEAAVSRFQLRPGDLVLEKSGGGEKAPVGFVARYVQGSDIAVCSNFMARLRARSDVDPLYLVHLFGALYDSGFTWGFIKQTTGIQNLDVSAFLGSSCSVPNREDQLRVAIKLEQERADTSDLVERLHRQVANIEEHRQALITAAVAGQVRVQETA